MKWLNELKIAFLNKNEQRFSELLDNTPTLQTKEEIFEVLNILEEMANYVKAQKDSLSLEMKKLKQTKKFIPNQKENSSFHLWL